MIDISRNDFPRDAGKARLFWTRVLFLAIGVIVLAFASECSPLYGLSNSVDVNAFRSSALYMLDGKTLYTDFFEVKGPYIYFLYVIGLLISPSNLCGVYILEVAAAFFYFEYSHRAMRVLFPDLSDNMLALGTAIGCAGTYLSPIIWRGGEVEEFCLPAYAYIAYLLAGVIKNAKMPDTKQCLSAGLHIGLIFWTKYLALVPYIGCLAVFFALCLRRKGMRAFGLAVSRCAAGFIAVTVPTACYFAASGSFGAMLRIYFYENIFTYHIEQAGLLFTLGLYPILNAVQAVSIAVLMTASLADTGRKAADRSYLGLVACFALSAVIIFSLRCSWLYYYIPLASYNALFACAALNAFRPAPRFLPALLLAASVAAQYAVSDMPYLFGTREDTYEARIEAADILGDSSFLILNRMDDGLYYATGYLPDEYYFTRVNSRLEESLGAYSERISGGTVDAAVVYHYDVRSPDILESDLENPSVRAYFEQLSMLEELLGASGYEEAGSVRLSSGYDIRIYKKGAA